MTERPSTDRLAKIDVRQLRVSYGSGAEVLHEVSVAVEPGETLSLLGPSGCGKTTLLRAIAGLQEPTSGSIEIGNQVVFDSGIFVEPNKRRVGMVFQDGALFPHLSVADNIAFGLRAVEDVDGRVNEMLALTELESLADRLPDSLSGGQRQRVALARALAPRPDVLLLDEPFSALDAGMRTQIRRDVKRILDTIGITTIVVTHDQDEAFVMGERVALMFDGRVAQIGRSTELYDSPNSPWIAQFVGEANLVAGKLDVSNPNDLTVTTDLGQLPARLPAKVDPAVGQPSPVQVLIRPEHLRLAHPGAAPGTGAAGASTTTAIRATIESAEYFGHDVLYELHCEHAAQSTVLAVRTADSSFRIGDSADVEFVGGRCIVWPTTS